MIGGLIDDEQVGFRAERGCVDQIFTLKSKVVVLNGEYGLECEVHVEGIPLEHVSEFKYLGCVLDKSGTDESECSRKVASGRRDAGAIRFLVNAMDSQHECTSLA